MNIRTDFSSEEKEFLKQFECLNDITYENLRTLFQEHYRHSQHQETQRGTFMSVLGAIVAAIVAFHGQLSSADLYAKLAVLTIGLAISLMGFVLIYTWNRPFIRHYLIRRETLPLRQ